MFVVPLVILDLLFRRDGLLAERGGRLGTDGLRLPGLPLLQRMRSAPGRRTSGGGFRSW